MRDAPLRHAGERVWILSPALVTAVFFALKLALGASGSLVSSTVSGAGAQTPVAVPVKVWVVSELRRVDDAPRAKRVVPSSEADLLRLLEQEGTVTFLSDEVEVVATSAPEFEPHQVNIDTSRRATSTAPSPITP